MRNFVPKMKCNWCEDGGLLERDHDTEWGIPCHSGEAYRQNMGCPLH